MMRLLLQWVLSALSLMLVAKLLPGFQIKDFGNALGVAAVYGILHVVLYPVLMFMAFNKGHEQQHGVEHNVKISRRLPRLPTHYQNP